MSEEYNKFPSHNSKFNKISIFYITDELEWQTKCFNQILNNLCVAIKCDVIFIGIKHFQICHNKLIHIFCFPTPNCPHFAPTFFLTLTPECYVTILIICLNHQCKSNYFQLVSKCSIMVLNCIAICFCFYFYFLLPLLNANALNPKSSFFSIENGNYTTEWKKKTKNPPLYDFVIKRKQTVAEQP